MNLRTTAAITAGASLAVAAGLAVAAQDKKPEKDVATLTARLKTAVSTSKSKVGDKIDAVSSTPLVLLGRTVATAGC